MNNQLLSVIITVYNEEKYVGKCINSVINQTYRNLDILIVDDGSSDNSPTICDNYPMLDNRVRVIHKTNGGSVSARKAGVLEARGEYITYIDGDDWLLPTHYEEIMSEIDDADMLAFSLTCVYSDNKTEIISNSAKNGIYVDADLFELKKIALYSGEMGKFGLFPSMCAKVFRTNLIRQNMLNVHDNIRMGDDGACTFPSICDSRKIIVNNRISGYIYRKTDGNTITSSYNYVEFERIENLYNVLLQAFTNRHADYMFEQLTYYLAFLFRTEMVYELAYLRPSNLFTKIQHLKEVRNLDWVKYVIKNVSPSKVDDNTKTLIKYINNIPLLLLNWYFIP